MQLLISIYRKKFLFLERFIKFAYELISMMEKMFSKVGSKILFAMARRPYEDLYLNRLSSELGVGLGGTRDLLHKFEKNGLLNKRRDGNRILYRLNRNSPMTYEIVYMAHTDRLLSLPKRFRTAITRLRDRYKEILGNRIVSMIVFGSVSKGTARLWSDIDVMTIVETKPRKNEREKLEKAQHEISRVFSEHSQVHMWTKKQFLKNYEIGDDFLINIMQDGVIVLDRDRFFVDHLMKGLPEVTKKSIRARLDIAGRELENVREFYRKSPRSAASFLNVISIHLCRGVLLLNHIIPGSKHEIPKQLEKTGNKNLAVAYKLTRKWWDEAPLDVKQEKVQKTIDLLEEKYQEASKRLEDWK